MKLRLKESLFSHTNRTPRVNGVASMSWPGKKSYSLMSGVRFLRFPY